jgi:hypothetical protein
MPLWAKLTAEPVIAVVPPRLFELSGCICFLHDLQSFLAAFRRLRAPTLNSARQFLLPLQLDDGVLLAGLRVGVAGDFAGLDPAAADFLPPRDVGAA